MNQKPPYEIDADAIRTAGEPNRTRDLLRGLIADTRALLEGRQMRRLAKDKRSQAVADEAYRQRMAAAQEKRLALTEDANALDKEKFDQQKRIREEQEKRDKTIFESQEAEKAAIESLGKMWDTQLKTWMDARLKLGSLGDDADPAERKRLTDQLHAMGVWLEANAKQLNRDFTAYSDWTETDEEASAEKKATDKVEADKLKKIEYIENHPEWDDATKQRLTAQAEITPEASISELVKAVDTEQQLTETEAAAEQKRLAEVETAKAHAEKYKDEIIKNTSEARYEDLLFDITHAEKPLEIDVEKYLIEDEDKTKDNKLTEDMAAYAALLEKQGFAPDRISELMKARLEKEALGTPTQTEQALSKVLDAADNVKDLQPYMVAIGGKGSPSTRKTAIQWATLGEFAQNGDREMVLDTLGDMYDALDRTKEADGRLEAAHIMQTIRDKILDLDRKFGLEPSRTLAAITERMTEQSFNSWWQGGGVDFFSGMNLTDEQITAAVELQTYINNNLVSFIKRTSGTAVAEQEYERLTRIMPGLFNNTAANMGIIDGNINLLRDQQFRYYESHSSNEVAKEIMATQGWGDIQTSTEETETKIDGEKLWDELTGGDEE